MKVLRWDRQTLPGCREMWVGTSPCGAARATIIRAGGVWQARYGPEPEAVAFCNTGLDDLMHYCACSPSERKALMRRQERAQRK